MRRLFYILIAVLIAGCGSEGTMAPERKTVEIRLGTGVFGARVIDDDNLESEQEIIHLSVFLTLPGDQTITHKFINAGFTTVEDYRLVTLPLDPLELGNRDIYVIANYNDDTLLEQIATLSDMKELKAPPVDKNNNLDPDNGFCMFGKTLDYNFLINIAPTVNLKRICAKFRIRLTFPENTTLSTDNSFVITHAARYAFVSDNVTGIILPAESYFDFALPIELEPDGTGYFVNLAYCYEAPQPPKIYIYTHINGSSVAQEYSADLPQPVRNSLYDIEIRIYEGNSVTRASDARKEEYVYEMVVNES